METTTMIIFVELVANGWWAVTGLIYPNDSEAQPEDAEVSREFPTRADALEYARELQRGIADAYIEAEAER